MKKWPHALQTYSPTEVKVFCVQDAEWQKFRLSMKGVPTERKLDMLDAWREQKFKAVGHNCFLPRRTQVQCDNYLNALKRGGQLNMNLEVQR